MHECYNRWHNTKLRHVYIRHVSSKYYICLLLLQARPQAKVDNDLEDVLCMLDIGGNAMCQCKYSILQ